MLSISSALQALDVHKSVFDYLSRVISFTLPLNFFLLGCELFSEFYAGSSHALSPQYLFFGLRGRGVLRPYIWTGLTGLLRKAPYPSDVR